MPQPRGEQIQVKSLPLDRVVDGNSNYAVVYNDSGELVETPSLLVFDSGDVEVLGSLIAGTEKLFSIQHPDKPGFKLQHACVEGPEIAVYCRGKEAGGTKVSWPDYWTDNFIDWDSVTVHLTAGGPGSIWLEEYDESGFVIGNPDNMRFTWVAYATRVDVPQLVVERQMSPDEINRFEVSSDPGGSTRTD